MDLRSVKYLCKIVIKYKKHDKKARDTMILLKIAVCDDNREDLETIQKKVSRILFSRAEYTITCYRDGTELVRAIEEGRFDSDLVLLDIHMKRLFSLTYHLKSVYIHQYE